MTLLEARGLYKTFSHPTRVEVLNDVSLSVDAGASIAVTGRSGEGKTTLLHILGGLEPVDSGEIRVFGEKMSPRDAPKFRNLHFGFIFQSFHLLDDLTVFENVTLPARIARRPVTKKQGLELLAQVGLVERADFPARVLSGGEKQRVAIARAFCNDPDLLFADEPTGNLDRTNAAAVGDLLFELVQTHKKALVLVTHDTALASRCQKKFELTAGNLIASNL